MGTRIYDLSFSLNSTKFPNSHRIMPSAMKIDDSVRRHTHTIAETLANKAHDRRHTIMVKELHPKVSVKTIPAGDSLAKNKACAKSGKCGQVLRPRNFKAWYAVNNHELSRHNSTSS